MSTANFNSWSDFREYGINFLTGESCAYSMRPLCDLSAKGKDIVSVFLGLPVDAQMNKNWNSRVGEDEAIASILLPRGMFKELARFIAFHVLGHKYVVVMADGSVHSYADGYMENHGLSIEKAKDLLNGDWYTNHNHANSVGGRNVHAFTGRTA